MKIKEMMAEAKVKVVTSLLAKNTVSIIERKKTGNYYLRTNRFLRIEKSRKWRELKSQILLFLFFQKDGIINGKEEKDIQYHINCVEYVYIFVCSDYDRDILGKG